MNRRRVVVGVAALAAASAGGGTAAPKQPLPSLHRPLHFPRLAAGEGCPLSSARPASQLLRGHGNEPLVGHGPVYAMLFAGPRP